MLQKMASGSVSESSEYFFALNFIAAILDLITTGKANKLFTVGIKKQILKILHDKLDCFVFNGNFLAFDKAV